MRTADVAVNRPPTPRRAACRGRGRRAGGSRPALMPRSAAIPRGCRRSNAWRTITWRCESGQGAHRADHACRSVSRRANDVLGLVAAEQVVGHRARARAAVAGDVQRRVAGDPVQPRLERERQRVPPVRRAWALMNVCCSASSAAAAARIAAAVARQRRAVAVDDRGERALVARAGERDQARVGRGGERGGAEAGE